MGKCSGRCTLVAFCCLQLAWDPLCGFDLATESPNVPGAICSISSGVGSESYTVQLAAALSNWRLNWDPFPELVTKHSPLNALDDYGVLGRKALRFIWLPHRVEWTAVPKLPQAVIPKTGHQGRGSLFQKMLPYRMPPA
ncbi:hypothetical protein ACRRTK_016538 [Alexandromys fortis]